MAEAPRRRVPPGAAGPADQSRGAGAAAPASAAARSPLEGATGGAQTAAEPVYDPSREAESPAKTTADEGAGTDFNAGLRRDHMSLGERGGSADREVVEHAAAETFSDPEDLAAEVERIRAFRKPLGAYSQKLALPVRQGYHRHWFNDVAGRIEEAELNGWAHVLGKDRKPISRCVGSGRDKGAMYAFAMEIPEVFWQEDQDAKNQAATDRIDSLKKTPFRAEAGSATTSDKGKFYDPTETDAGPLQVVKSK